MSIGSNRPVTMDQLWTQIDTNTANLDFTEVFGDVADLLCETHQGYFAAQADPNGNAWAPLSPVTIAKKGHSVILIETDAMRQSVTGRQSANHLESFDALSMEWGTSDEKAGLHQAGTNFMPQRQFVGWNDPSIDAAVNTIADEAMNQILEGIGI